jgi:CheY-like chemotaxis protein
LDDSQVLVELTTKSLSAVGVEAKGALDLSELDQALAGHPFDLILVDVKMPEAFGDDVLDFLRVQRQVRSKLVLYSDLPESELAEKARNCAADGYICKARGLESAVADVLRMLGASLEPAQPALRLPELAHRKKRILVVDDSGLRVRRLEQQLSSRNVEVTAADTTDRATKLILHKRSRPDLVLIDIKAPGVNAEELCQFIKRNPLFAEIKVFLCSGEGSAELKVICQNLGADGYIPTEAMLEQLVANEFH